MSDKEKKGTSKFQFSTGTDLSNEEVLEKVSHKKEEKVQEEKKSRRSTPEKEKVDEKKDVKVSYEGKTYSLKKEENTLEEYVLEDEEGEKEEEEEKSNTSPIRVSDVVHAYDENDLVVDKKIRKIHFSFQARVTVLSICIIALFVSASVLIITTLSSNEVREIKYVEDSSVHHKVCLTSNDPYNVQCLEEGTMYSSNTASNIPIEFHYEAKFKEAIDYDLSYYVVLSHRIYDASNESNISYEDENLIVEKTNIRKNQNPASVDVNAEIDYLKYQKFVTEYQTKYSMNTKSVVDVILYVDDGVETRNVAQVQIPLGVENFNISKKSVHDVSQIYTLEVKEWTNRNTLYIVTGSIFILVSLFLMFRLTRLSLLTLNKRTKYQQRLMNILNGYDRLIVIARDGYESTEEKKILKVASFEELLDARSILNKPIIFSKINSIKSEFIVEDEEIIYKYILKEADIEDK